MKTKTLLALALLSAPLAGCGGNGTKLVPVSGTVTVNGQPLPDAVIIFEPDPTSPGAAHAENRTGPRGEYKPLTKGRTGVAPGRYVVYVNHVPEATLAKVKYHNDDPFMKRLTAASLENPRSKKKAAPEAGGVINASFPREVTAGGGTFNFDIEVKTASSPRDPKASSSAVTSHPGRPSL
jgi:hypothetical protein